MVLPAVGRLISWLSGSRTVEDEGMERCVPIWGCLLLSSCTLPALLKSAALLLPFSYMEGEGKSHPATQFKELARGTLFQLHGPQDAEATLDVVFFHGLQAPGGGYRTAWWHSWESKRPDGSALCWPAELLGADFPLARILSVSYSDASAPIRSGADLIAIGRSLASAILGGGVGLRPTILVGHGLGGLVLQRVCLEWEKLASSPQDAAATRDRAADALSNVLGAVFYSTPLAGARLADALPASLWPSPVLSYLQTLSKEQAQLSDAFRELRGKKAGGRLASMRS